MSLIHIAKLDGRFKTLLHLVEVAGLTKTLSQVQNLTIFAPTDEAFASLGTGAVSTLLLPEKRDKLKRILLYHVLAMPVYAKDIVGTATPVTMEGKNLCIFLAGPAGAKSVHVNDAKVIAADVQATNGVAHVIDRVLNPLEGCHSCLGNCKYQEKEGYEPISPPGSPKFDIFSTGPPKKVASDSVLGKKTGKASSVFAKQKM